MPLEKPDGRAGDPEELLLRTDWNTVEHCCPNVALETPAILRRLLGEDPCDQGRALRDLYHAVLHQNSLYSATAPAAAYVAAILGHPRTLVAVTPQSSWEAAHDPEEPRPLRTHLLDWPGAAAEDAGEEPPSGEQAAVEAFRALRPALYDAIVPFLDDDEPEVRMAALAAVLPLLRAPGLEHRIADFRERAWELAVGTTRHRWSAIHALTAWGEDTTGFRETVEIPAAPIGCSDDPPF